MSSSKKSKSTIKATRALFRRLVGIGKVKNSSLGSLNNGSTHGTPDCSPAVDTEIAGTGAFGIEGGALAHYFRSSESMASIKIEESTSSSIAGLPLSNEGDGSITSLQQLYRERMQSESPNESISSIENKGTRLSPEVLSWSSNKLKSKSKIVSATYGPGVANTHPWSTRLDHGINARSVDGKVRGAEIYFCGVIDILQQYNIFKQTENIIKVFYLLYFLFCELFNGII